MARQANGPTRRALSEPTPKEIAFSFLFLLQFLPGCRAHLRRRSHVRGRRPFLLLKQLVEGAIALAKNCQNFFYLKRTDLSRENFVCVPQGWFLQDWFLRDWFLSVRSPSPSHSLRRRWRKIPARIPTPMPMHSRSPSSLMHRAAAPTSRRRTDHGSNSPAVKAAAYLHAGPRKIPADALSYLLIWLASGRLPGRTRARRAPPAPRPGISGAGPPPSPSSIEPTGLRKIPQAFAGAAGPVRLSRPL